MKWRRFTVIVKSSTTIVDKCVSTCDRARAKNTKKLNKYREEKFKVARSECFMLTPISRAGGRGLILKWSLLCQSMDLEIQFVWEFNMWDVSERRENEIAGWPDSRCTSFQHSDRTCVLGYLYIQTILFVSSCDRFAVSLSFIPNMTSRVRKMCIHKTFFNKLKFCLFVDRDDLVY